MSIKSGDLFKLGNSQLICGDAKDPMITKRLIQNLRINLILADPPYGVAYVESKAGLVKVHKDKVIVNDHDQSDQEYRLFTKDWLNAVKDYLNIKNTVYIFNSDKMLFALREGMQDSGFKFTQLIIWIKNHAVMGRMDYLPQHELIAYGWYGSHNFHKAKDKSLIFCPKPNKSILHPTMKPISLLRRLILNSTKVGDVVYDPFGGSGSSLIASYQTQRRCLMIELDPDYCQVIIDRWRKITGLEVKKINI